MKYERKKLIPCAITITHSRSGINKQLITKKCQSIMKRRFMLLQHSISLVCRLAMRNGACVKKIKRNLEQFSEGRIHFEFFECNNWVDSCYSYLVNFVKRILEIFYPFWPFAFEIAWNLYVGNMLLLIDNENEIRESAQKICVAC